ncbi:MAG: hypothetical protein Q9226_007086 [Calogaya cf. arnoldii]
MSIQENLTACLQAFDNLVRYTETNDYPKEGEVPKGSWITQLGRLRIWAANVNALESGNASLDHILRDPPLRAGLHGIRDQIFKLLGDIKQTLKGVLEEEISAGDSEYEELFEDQTLLQGEMPPISVNTLLNTLSLLYTFLASPVVAQTWTSCNPLNTTDCPTNPALSTEHTYHFTNSSIDDTWNTTADSLTYSQMSGAHFTIATRGDAPTIQSEYYLFGGELEVWMRAATGTGVVSSIVLQSEDLDEVDWEILGGNVTHVQSNYFGKGNTTSYDRAIWHPTSFQPQEDFHNYTTRWTKDEIEWYIDGASVRLLKSAEANGGENFPQTPMNVRLGVWAGGDEDNPKDTVEWAGGETDYDEAPFTMSIKSVRVKDYSKGKEYVYGDMTGSWDSIEIVPYVSLPLLSPFDRE